MNKIGTTTSGTIIVELTPAQYDNLAQFQTSQTTAVSIAKSEITKMTTAEKVGFVRERIVKLNPKKKEGLIRSISTMFQFNGGIGNQEIQKIIGSLQTEKVLAIDTNERVTYKKV